MALPWLLACASVRGDQVRTLEILTRIPHTGYSEGLDWHEGYLWHAMPKEIVRIDPKDGAVLDRFAPASEYSESLVWAKGTLFNVSYSDNGLYAGKQVGKTLAFQRVGSVPEVHAWGIEHDGKNLVVTGNYSPKLYFLDPATGAVRRTVETKVADLEDLAWDGRGLWSSSFTAYRGMIFRIDAQTGAVSGLFQLPAPDECPIVDGLAFDGTALWVTGKNCPAIYKVRLPTERMLSSK